MNEKLKIQISFATHGPNLSYVKHQLQRLAEENQNCEFYCGFLTRKQLKAAKMDTEIVDILDSTLGNRLTYLSDNFINRDEVMDNLSFINKELNDMCDYHFVLGLIVSPNLQEQVIRSSGGKTILYI